MIVGALVMQVLGIISNIYLLLPAYGMKMNSAELSKYVFVGILPFNAIKASIVGVSTYLLYKKVSIAIFKVDHNFGKKKKQVAH